MKLKIKYKLFFLNSKVSAVIFKLVFKLIINDFKKLINDLVDSKIAMTSNKIENCFLNNFSKHIKNYLKQIAEF